MSYDCYSTNVRMRCLGYGSARTISKLMYIFSLSSKKLFPAKYLRYFVELEQQQAGLSPMLLINCKDYFSKELKHLSLFGSQEFDG